MTVSTREDLAVGETGQSDAASSNYILATDRRCFEMVGIRGLQNYPSDHLVLWDSLIFSPTGEGHQCNAWCIPEKVGTVHGGSKETGR